MPIQIATVAWFNDPVQIADHLTALTQLRKLRLARTRAGARDDLILYPYFILGGRFFLDSHGNTRTVFCTQDGRTIYDTSPDAPLVMTREQLPLHGFTKSGQLQIGDHAHTPTSNARCTICQQPWSIETCHNVSSHLEPRVHQLDQYAGQRINDVRRHLGQQEGASYFGGAYSVQVRERPVQHLTGSTRITTGSQATFTVRLYRHITCPGL